MKPTELEMQTIKTFAAAIPEVSAALLSLIEEVERKRNAPQIKWLRMVGGPFDNVQVPDSREGVPPLYCFAYDPNLHESALSFGESPMRASSMQRLVYALEAVYEERGQTIAYYRFTEPSLRTIFGARH